VTRRLRTSRLPLLLTSLVLAACGGDEEVAGGAADLPGPVPSGVEYAEPPASALPAPPFEAKLVDGTTVRGSELWDDRPYLVVFTASFCDRCRDIHRAAAGAVDGQGGAAGLLGVVGTDDTGAAEYADELDLGYPIGSADERAWRNFAAREPGLVVLVARGGEVVRGWPRQPTEAELTDALGALIER
jgi:thiol-disulfide isomerase/thioredoxin